MFNQSSAIFHFEPSKQLPSIKNIPNLSRIYFPLDNTTEIMFLFMFVILPT